MDVDKVVITNMGALKEKYGSKMARVDRALALLVAADRKRGVETRLVSVDSTADMQAVGAAAVADKGDQKGVKAAVDAVFRAYHPDYLLILGAPDVIPHQELRNPAYDPAGDDDRVVPSDMPYACEAPYSKNPARFVGPTRVVGRLPDLPGNADPAFLASLLGTAARHRTRTRADYRKYFSVTAQAWEKSTALSLTKVFGSSAAMATSPPRGPAWSTAQLSPRMHFINCHGAPSDPNFYGQRGNSYPVAHSAARIVKKIMNGTSFSTTNSCSYASNC